MKTFLARVARLTGGLSRHLVADKRTMANPAYEIHLNNHISTGVRTVDGIFGRFPALGLMSGAVFAFECEGKWFAHWALSSVANESHLNEGILGPCRNAAEAMAEGIQYAFNVCPEDPQGIYLADSWKYDEDDDQDDDDEDVGECICDNCIPPNGVYRARNPEIFMINPFMN